MKSILRWAMALGITMMALWSGTASAESQYGYASSGTGTVTAQARVGVVVTVPKLILLRVGSTNTTVDTVTFTVSATIPATTSATNGSNTNVDWNTSAPIFSANSPAALTATAFSNVSGSAISCSVSTFPTGGITLANFTVTVGGSAQLTHAADLSGCATPQVFTAGSVRSSTWAYALDTTSAATWTPGSYTGQITYTATTN